MKKTLTALVALLLLSSLTVKAQNEKTFFYKNVDAKWWKEVIVYQIYPRSFKDSDGDGVGDLKGIISKLDYIKSLGIDVVWLNPIYSSPNADNGYDISDYQTIMSEFGTMEDFDALLNEMHKRDIKLIMDLVANHSSDEHKWFQQSRKSRDNPYRDYYHWWPAENGKPAKRFSPFDDNYDAWKYDSLTNAYYLHYFSTKQPDLNWENPQLRKEFYETMKFWLDKGVDGFRMDVISFIAKDTKFPEVDWNKYPDAFQYYYESGTNLHTYLQEMNKEVLSKYNIMTVGEGAPYLKVLDFTDPSRKELNMMYAGTTPEISKDSLTTGVPYDLIKLKQFFTTADSSCQNKGWPTLLLGNHDLPRIVSLFGNDKPEFKTQSSKMLSTMLLSMRGTPFWYFGDELGMSNIRFNNIEDYNDIFTINGYKYILKNEGEAKAKEYLESQKRTARDNSRTPFQWNSSENAGFSTGKKTWLKTNPNYNKINAEKQENDPYSVLNYFRKMVQLRKSNLVLIYGKYTLLDEHNPQVYSYTRELDNKKLLVLLNFSSKTAPVNINYNIAESKVLVNNYPKPLLDKKLRPYEAIIIEIK